MLSNRRIVTMLCGTCALGLLLADAAPARAGLLRQTYRRRAGPLWYIGPVLHELGRTLMPVRKESYEPFYSDQFGYHSPEWQPWPERPESAPLPPEPPEGGEVLPEEAPPTEGAPPAEAVPPSRPVTPEPFAPEPLPTPEPFAPEPLEGSQPEPSATGAGWPTQQSPSQPAPSEGAPALPETVVPEPIEPMSGGAPRLEPLRSRGRSLLVSPSESSIAASAPPGGAAREPLIPRAVGPRAVGPRLADPRGRLQTPP